MSDLKPCPFCGGRAHLWIDREYEDPTHVVSCKDCQASVERDLAVHAIAVWNTRTEDNSDA